MKGKHLLLLLVLVAVLGGAGYHLYQGNQDSWIAREAGAGGKVLEFPINEVARVQIKSATGEVNLVQNPEGWVVEERAGFPANYEQVSNLVRKLWELKTVQDVKVGPSQMGRLELVEPTEAGSPGVRIELKDKESKSLGGMLLGKQHTGPSQGAPGGMDGFSGGAATGRYVMPLAGKKVSLVSESLSEFEAKPERWLAKEFIAVQNPISVEVAGQTETTRWKLARENSTAEWKLADLKPGEEVDAAKVSPFSSILSGGAFKDVLLPDAKPEETGLAKPTVATIETTDALTYTFKIGNLIGDTYPLQIAVAGKLDEERKPAPDEKPEDKTRLDGEFKTKRTRLEEKLATEKKLEGRTFLVEKFVVENLLKERSTFLAEKKPEPEPPASATATPPQPSIPAIPPAPAAASAPVAPPTPTSAPPTPAEPAPAPAIPAPAAPVTATPAAETPPTTSAPLPPSVTPPMPTPAPPVPPAEPPTVTTPPAPAPSPAPAPEPPPEATLVPATPPAPSSVPATPAPAETRTTPQPEPEPAKPTETQTPETPPVLAVPGASQN